MFICILVKTSLEPHNSHLEFYSSYISMPIESYLFRARVGASNFNMRSFKQKPNRHIKKGITITS